YIDMYGFTRCRLCRLNDDKRETMRRWFQPEEGQEEHGWERLADRQPQPSPAAPAPGPVRESQRAPVGLGDLAGEHQADAGAAWLGREERHEQVGGALQARAFVVDADLDGTPLADPAHVDAAAGLECGVGGVAQQVDDELFDLVAVGLQRD